MARPCSASSASAATQLWRGLVLFSAVTQWRCATTTAAAFGPSCGMFAEQFADMHDGDVKNVSMTEAGVLTLSQGSPVAWTLSTQINLDTCVATVDFSKSKKPAFPPVPLAVTLLQSTAGTLLLEFTDPSGTLNPDPEYPLNVWTTHPELPAAEPCASFADTHFQDLHDGDIKVVSVVEGTHDPLVLRMGQPGVWNLTAAVDPRTCKATIDFSKSAKPAFPPVPLLASVTVATGNDRRRRVVVTFTDPSKTLNPDPEYPLNIWESVPPSLRHADAK